MADTISAFEFLREKKSACAPAVCVLFGDEPLLKRGSLQRLREAVLSGEDADLSIKTFNGNEVELREVLDELATVSMFGGGKRMVVVEEADEFVSANRAALEDYCEKPRKSSVLVLA